MAHPTKGSCARSYEPRSKSASEHPAYLQRHFETATERRARRGPPVLPANVEQRSHIHVVGQDLLDQRDKFSRQLFLGEGLDRESITASYDQGVLTVRIPVAARAKPRRIEISGGGSPQAIEAETA